jgi:hypothetical protein
MRKLLLLAVASLSFGAFACSGGSSQQTPPGPAPTGPVADKPVDPPPTAKPDPMPATPDPKPDPGQAKPDPSQSKPDPGPAPTPAGKGPGLHEKCGAGDACGVGACVTYYGIAGPRGPQFKTCEIKCDKTTKCPDGMKCAVVADGPGQTCR